LAQVLQSLPDETDRDRLSKSLDTIIEFFVDLKRRIEALPSTRDCGRTLAALDEIASFLTRSKGDPILANALGLRYDRDSRRFPSSLPPQSSKSAEAWLDELKSLTTDEIQARLNDYKRVTMNDLRGIARQLGLKYEERMKRQDLVDRIVKVGFANVRGYDLLRGKSSS